MMRCPPASLIHPVATSDAEWLRSAVADAWAAHENKAAVAVRWDAFGLSDLQVRCRRRRRCCFPHVGLTSSAVQEIVVCMGAGVVHAVCRRLATDLRHSGGGLPDLTLWNADTCTCKLVEVKSPNDRMSEKQLLWADVLLAAGADYHICRVSVSNARRIPVRADT